MYMYLCLRSQPPVPKKKNLRGGGGPSGSRGPLSFLSGLSLFRASTLAFLNPEFGNACVCTDPPSPNLYV